MPESFHARFPVSAIYLYSDLHLFFAPSSLAASAHGRQESSPLQLIASRAIKNLWYTGLKPLETGRLKEAGRAVLKTAPRNS